MSTNSSKRRRGPKRKTIISESTASLCFLCRKNDVTSFKNIAKILAPASGESIRAILIKLSECLEAARNIPGDKPICQSCYMDVVDFDEYVFMSEAIKWRITQYLSELEERCRTTETEFVFTERDEHIKESDNHPIEPLNEPEFSIESSVDLLAEATVRAPCLAEPEMPVKDLLEIKPSYHELPTENNENLKSPSASPDEWVSSPEEWKPILSCLNCNKRFKSKSQLQKHIAELHNSATYPICGVCGVVARDDEYLDLHMNLHEGKTENECRYCNKRYTRKKSVIRHMQKHWDKQQLQCDKCGLRFSETTVLYNHRLQHEAMEEPLICSVCQRVFKTKRTYNAHMITHRADRPRYNCTYCPKTFVEKYTLKVHLRQHEQSDEHHRVENVTTKEPKAKIKAEHNCVICGCRFGTMECYEFHMQKEHDVIMSEGGS